MDAETGVVVLNATDNSLLDPNSRGVVHFMLIADDSRNHTASTLVVVQLHNGPVFDQSQQYYGYVAENSISFIVPVTVQVRTCEIGAIVRITIQYVCSHQC